MVNQENLLDHITELCIRITFDQTYLTGDNLQNHVIAPWPCNAVMNILNYMLDIRISFYISSICHSVIYLIFLDSKSPFSNYKTFSSFMELNLPTTT